ncbi:class I glutamine amidotransferase-like protein [Cylindrobasidium torrendii FP15055 ss-10]|uniref:Class I glutamine amidotransferase-like protein n=1 Tax=Cylindrobasidium torrendii FP15055 ss-10 TaxID=1314674 RepID=A0A0D7BBC5_9AGAR|nr:class I glutamine amidotransferase-like protein [Cylindrobasidium torrendii FP15055 ss-10]
MRAERPTCYPSIIIYVKSPADTPLKNFAVVVFPGFQALDVFGPLDALNILSKQFPIRLSIIAESLSPVSTRTQSHPDSDCAQSIVPTHTFDSPPSDIEVLLLPGGMGTRSDDIMKGPIKFVKDIYPSLKFLITVCTGSTIASRAGVLDNKRATSNKRSWEWVITQGPRVEWVPHARWVQDGNIYTSSGVSAGIDVMLAFMDGVYGKDAAADVTNVMEYERHLDPNDDPFAPLYGL